MTHEDEAHPVDVAEHNGSIRIYEVNDIENWIQSDTSVTDILSETDSTRGVDDGN